MGTFRVSIEIGDPNGQRWQSVDTLVDTGATYTCVPGSVLHALGVEPAFRRRFLIADGREITRDMAETRIRLDGQEHTSFVVFADEGTEPLLGAYTLEGFSLAADPVGRRLVPVPGLLMQHG
jgi:clan AA aspartic protease